VTELIALLMGTFLAAAAAFHFYWGFGGQYGWNPIEIRAWPAPICVRPVLHRPTFEAPLKKI
jgi:hypothetical protein